MRLRLAPLSGGRPMPRSYSMDLRQRVIAACEAGGGTRREIARQCQVSKATLYDWLQRRRAQGSPAPKPHMSSRKSALHKTMLRALVAEEPCGSSRGIIGWSSPPRPVTSCRTRCRGRWRRRYVDFWRRTPRVLRFAAREATRDITVPRGATTHRGTVYLVSL